MRRNYSQRKDSMRRKKQDKGEKGKWETRVANSSWPREAIHFKSQTRNINKQMKRKISPHMNHLSLYGRWKEGF